MAPTAPVLAVLVCHDGETWLPESLGALGRLTVGPRRVIAVDTGSRDSTPDLLRSSNRVDVVLDLPHDTPFGTAVAAAVADADRRWGRTGDRSSGDWLWVLHDDAAPEPACLDVLLSVAESSPAAAVLGPLQLDWDDPRLVVEAGLSTDASGHRQTGIGSDELDLGQFATNSEVLAVGSAGALVRRREWDALGGYDSAYGLMREDVDLGWRVNRAGGLVLCVPSARLRHARAVTTGARPPEAARHRRRPAGRRPPQRHVDAARERLRRRLRDRARPPARARGAARDRLPAPAPAPRGQRRARGDGPRASPTSSDLREARRRRTASGTGDPRAVRGLLTSRTTRLRNAVSGGLAGIVRARVRDDLDLGRLPEWADRPDRGSRSAAGDADGPEEGSLLVGQGALPAGVTAPKRSTRRKAGLRRPGGDSVAVSLAEPGRRHRRGRPDGAARHPRGPPPRRRGPRGAHGPRRDPRARAPGPPGTGPRSPTGPRRRPDHPRPRPARAAARPAAAAGPRAHAPSRWWSTGRGSASTSPAGACARCRSWARSGAPTSPSGTPWPAGPPPRRRRPRRSSACSGRSCGRSRGRTARGVAVSLLLLGALPLAGLSAYLASRPLRVGRVLRALVRGRVRAARDRRGGRGAGPARRRSSP